MGKTVWEKAQEAFDKANTKKKPEDRIKASLKAVEKLKGAEPADAAQLKLVVDIHNKLVEDYQTSRPKGYLTEVTKHNNAARKITQKYNEAHQPQKAADSVANSSQSTPNRSNSGGSSNSSPTSSPAGSKEKFVVDSQSSSPVDTSGANALLNRPAPANSFAKKIEAERKDNLKFNSAEEAWDAALDLGLNRDGKSDDEKIALFNKTIAIYEKYPPLAKPDQSAELRKQAVDARECYAMDYDSLACAYHRKAGQAVKDGNKDLARDLICRGWISIEKSLQINPLSKHAQETMEAFRKTGANSVVVEVWKAEHAAEVSNNSEAIKPNNIKKREGAAIY